MFERVEEDLSSRVINRIDEKMAIAYPARTTAGEVKVVKPLIAT